MRGIGARHLASSQVVDWHGGARSVALPARARPVVPPPRVWLTADSAQAGVGNGATLTDLSPNGHDATITSGTLTVESATTPTGRDGLRRSALGNYATFGSGTWTGLTSLHLFAYVYGASSSAQRSRGPWWLSSVTDANHYPYSDEKLYVSDFATTRQAFLPTRLLRGAWRIVEVTANGTTNTFTLDGDLSLSWSSSLSLPSTGYLFDSYISGSSIAGHQIIADFRVYPTVLSPEAAAAVRADLIALYGETG